MNYKKVYFSNLTNYWGLESWNFSNNLVITNGSGKSQSQCKARQTRTVDCQPTKKKETKTDLADDSSH